jgi:PKD repeat protein
MAGVAHAAGGWVPTGNLNAVRQGTIAITLNNGRVLVIGGSNGLTPTAACELYDPATRAWTGTGELAAARLGAAACLLGNGKVLVCGGADANGSMRTSGELYDPATGSWTGTGSMAAGRLGHSVTVLQDGTVLAAGGARVVVTPSIPPSIDLVALSSCEIYNPASGTWSGTGSLVAARGGHTATLLGNGAVLATGGAQGQTTPSLASCETYDPTSRTWTAAGNMATARASHTATLLGTGKVLVAGGGTGEVTCELYDTAARTWSSTGSMATGRAAHTATIFSNGAVLVAGGTNAGGTTATSEIYDAGAGTWSATGSLITARSGHAAALLADGTVLAAAGSGSGGSGLAACEVYDPTLTAPVISSASTASGTAGDPFSYTITASGYPSSFGATNLPSGLAVDAATGVISGTPTMVGTANVTISATNSLGTGSAALAITIGPSTRPPVISEVTASQNPTKTGNTVTFTATASHPGGIPVSCTWDFGDGTATALGSSVTHSFAAEGAPTVRVTASDGATSVSATVEMTVFAPASGDAAWSILAGATATNPLNGVTITVVSVEGGVVELEVTLANATPETHSVSTSLDGPGRHLVTVSGWRPLWKFVDAGIFTATATVTEKATGQAATATITLPVSSGEIGEGSDGATPPVAKGFTAPNLRGKLVFNSTKPDMVTFKGTVEAPEGMTPARERACAVAVGNVADAVTLDAKGKATTTGTLGRVKKAQMKYPRLKKPATVTSAGLVTKVSFTLSVADMETLGLSDEGIGPAYKDDEATLKSVVRQVQVALVLGGTAYRAVVAVDYKLSSKKTSGQFKTQRVRK